ncbi:MAG: TetR/AcrR family transcriptional regulator [Reichenbachiella sp.]
MNVKHDKKKVLQKATELFSAKGYTALGVDEILKQTGMTKGAFYNSFVSKEAFLLEALELYSEHNTQRLLIKLAPREGLKAIAQLEQFYLEMLEMQDSINHKGCLVNNMMTELGGINHNITQAINRHFETIIKNILPTIRLAQNAGDLVNAISAEEIAEVIHSSFYGVLNRLKSNRNSESSKKTLKILFNVIKK